MKNRISPTHVKNQEKVKELLNSVDARNVESKTQMSSAWIEGLGYFQLTDMRYDDKNAVTERVSTTVL